MLRIIEYDEHNVSLIEGLVNQVAVIRDIHSERDRPQVVQLVLLTKMALCSSSLPSRGIR